LHPPQIHVVVSFVVGIFIKEEHGYTVWLLLPHQRYFFAKVQNNSLMANKEDGNYRPHYLAIQDSHNFQIYWMVPVSSKFEKYQNIYNHQVARYKKCI